MSKNKFLIATGVAVIGTVVCMVFRSGMTETGYPEKNASKYFYIQDYSGVFSEKAEKYIFDEAVKLNKATTAQIVVIAVPDTGSETLEQYSLRTANSLGIGSKEKDNGILILFTLMPEPAEFLMIMPSNLKMRSTGMRLP